MYSLLQKRKIAIALVAALTFASSGVSAQFAAAKLTHTTVLAAPAATDKPLVVEDQGFGQDGKSVAWVLKVRNPNSDQAIQRVEYQIAAYDDKDDLLKTDDGYIDLVLPTQTVGIVGTMYLDDDVKVAKIEVQLNDGEFESVEDFAAFTASAISYFPDKFAPKVTAKITNPLKVLVESLRINAVAYNKKGKIIGGGATFLSFIPAAGAAGVSLGVTTSEVPTKIEVFPMFSALSFFANTKSNPKDFKPLEIGLQGSSKVRSQVAYGFIVSNPNTNLLIESSQYQTAVYDAEGRVLAAGSGYIDALLPGEKLGIGDSFYLPDNVSATKTTLVVQISTGKATQSDLKPIFIVTNTKFKDDKFSPKVTAVIKNQLKKKIENFKVYALAYDAKGAIIGSGYTYIDFVPSGGQTPIEVRMNVSGKVAKIEVYPTLSSLSSIE